MRQARASIKGRRAELLAELLLQELNAEFVARPTTDLGYDFLVGFQNSKGGINNIVVEVKATEQPVSSRVAVDVTLYERLAHSNLPALLLVVDVKRNRLYYAWLTLDGAAGRRCGTAHNSHHQRFSQ